MYHSHFGLNQSPFSITPNPAFFYSGNKRGDILQALIYAVTHGEGIIKVTGEVGSGKTMLCRMLENMMPDSVEVIYLVNPSLSREEVMYTIAGELGIATGGKRPDEVIRLLHHDLIGKHIEGRQVVLLVEEAQAMPLETLEEIRLFSNLETARHKLLQIVLFGQPELNENLNLPRMRQLKERITHSFKVPPLSSSLIPEFLMFRMRAAGYHGPDLFTRRAIKLLAEVSEGIVRRVNILADKALLAAFSENTHAIEAKHIKAAILDSEFTPPKRSLQKKDWALLTLALSTITLAAALGWLQLRQAAQLVPAQPLPLAEHISANQATRLIEAEPPASNKNIQAASTNESSSPKPIEASSVSSTPETEIQLTPSPALSAPPALEESSSTLPLIQQRLAPSKEWLNQTPDNFYSLQLTVVSLDNPIKIEQELKKASQQLDLDHLYLYPTRIGDKPHLGILYSSFDTREKAWKRHKEIEANNNQNTQLRTIEGLKAEMQRVLSAQLW